MQLGTRLLGLHGMGIYRPRFNGRTTLDGSKTPGGAKRLYQFGELLKTWQEKLPLMKKDQLACALMMADCCTVTHYVEIRLVSLSFCMAVYRIVDSAERGEVLCRRVLESWVLDRQLGDPPVGYNTISEETYRGHVDYTYIFPPPVDATNPSNNTWFSAKAAWRWGDPEGTKYDDAKGDPMFDSAMPVMFVGDWLFDIGLVPVEDHIKAQAMLLEIRLRIPEQISPVWGCALPPDLARWRFKVLQEMLEDLWKTRCKSLRKRDELCHVKFGW
jgi:hypothetical protein